MNTYPCNRMVVGSLAVTTPPGAMLRSAFGWLLSFLLLLGSETRLGAQGGTVYQFFDPGAGANSTVYRVVTFTTEFIPGNFTTRCWVGGDFTTYGAQSRPRIALCQADGTIYNTFAPGAGFNNPVYALAVHGNGDAVVGGAFSSYNGTPVNYLARLSTTGALDTTFTPPALNGYVYCAAISQYYLGGRWWEDAIWIGGSFAGGIKKLNLDGTVDTSFNVGTGVNSLGTVTSLVPLSSGQVVIGGNFTSVNGVTRRGVARLNANGSVDSTFDPGAGPNQQVEALLVQADGKVVVGGRFSTFGGSSHGGIVRLNGNGSVDNSFTATGASGSLARVYALNWHASDRLLVGGDFYAMNGVTRYHLARLNNNGSLDTSFVPRDGPNNTVRCLHVRSQQAPFWIGGGFTYVDGIARSRLAMVNVDDPPVITSQPVDRTVANGANTSFTVVASGSSLTYRWLSNGVQVASGTAATLNLTNVQYNGPFSVRIVNTANTVTSRVAQLTVTYQPGTQLLPPAGAVTSLPPQWAPSDGAFWQPDERRLYAGNPANSGNVSITWYNASTNPIPVAAYVQNIPATQYTLTQEIPPPQDIDVAALRPNGPEVFPAGTAYWHAPTRKLYAAAVGLNYVNWNPTNGPQLRLLGTTIWPPGPVNYQFHVTRTPAVDLTSGGQLAYARLLDQESGVGVQATTVELDRQFSATNEGRALLLLAPGDPQTTDIYFQLVRVISPTNAARLVQRPTWIGEPVIDTDGYHDPSLGGPHIINPLSRYCAQPGYYDRSARTGPIIPVNRDRSDTDTDDLIVAYYQKGTNLLNALTRAKVPNAIAWPHQPVRYDCQWPAVAPVITISSGQGSGEIDATRHKNWDIFVQNDPASPGFNPNDEHAFRAPFAGGEALFALRDDLGTAATSDAYVLMTYRDGLDADAPKVKVFRVAAGSFSPSATAGDLIRSPSPVGLLPVTWCAESYAASGPWWRDRKGYLWVKSAGHSGLSTNLVLRFYYAIQDGFYFPATYFPHFPPGVPATTLPTANAHFPWLDLRGGTPGTPLSISYTVNWPTNAPVLKVGDTVVDRAKDGINAVGGYKSVEILYQQSRTNGQGDSVKLINPTKVRKVRLEKLPDDVAKSDRSGTNYLTSLPPHLRSRVWHVPAQTNLYLAGQYVTTGPPYLLLNVLTGRDSNSLASLSTDPAYRAAVTELATTAGSVIEVPPNTPFDAPSALTAGDAKGSGFVTLAFGNSTNLNDPDDPIELQVIQVQCPPFSGRIAVIESENPFDEKLTLRHTGDFAGRADHYYFEWRTLPPGPGGGVPTAHPTNWFASPTSPADGLGAVDVTLEGPGLFTLSDNWFICSYRPRGTNACGAEWSAWTEPCLAEGWIKRVLKGINPFEQRFTNYHQAQVNTVVSMISQAGPPYAGGVPLDAEAANAYGLIEIYRTVLERGRGLSIEGSSPVNYPPANDALLLAAGRLADLYQLLGNEAYADAADPTIGYRIGEGGYGEESSSIHCFQNQTGSLLEEELSLLRGRDDTYQPSVRDSPFFNRLLWNFTRGDGEVAYTQNYGATDLAEAQRLYPQGHGDAWGHYLSAVKGYYSLLHNPNFTWVPRSETINMGGHEASVDYLDERKFAGAAAARARAGAEIVGLTYRGCYVEDPDGQWQGYVDAVAERAWGMADWGSRAGQGALFDWAVGNTLLPAVSTNTGVRRVDRTTVPELREIAAAFQDIQEEVDKADLGLNPLGLSKNGVPFDISPAEITANQTHFEQIYKRAVKAMNNAIAVFNHANNATRLLRRQADTAEDFERTVTEREADFNNRLIEIFGYPYAEDIGAGATYPSGYVGPDLYHFAYVDSGDLGARTPSASHPVTVQLREPVVDPANGSLTEETNNVVFHLADDAYELVKPSGWTRRSAPGEIQRALSELIQSRTRFERALVEYDNLLAQIEDQAALLRRQFELNDREIGVLDRSRQAQMSLNERIMTSRIVQLGFRKAARIAVLMANGIAEALPKSVGVSTDATAPARSAIMLAGTVASEIAEVGADVASLVELDHQQAKEMSQAASNFELTTVRQEQAILQQLAQIQQLVRQEACLRLELYTMQEALMQAGGNFRSSLQRGYRLLEDRLRFRQQTATSIRSYRYQDMAFRIFRNDALQKYRAQFDLAARYVYLAAKAYDFETNLRDGDPRRPGQEFISAIVRARTIGLIQDGAPQTGTLTGDAGLADPMARMFSNWDLVLKGQLGFDNPATETGRFSLRSELFRIKPGEAGNLVWRETLSRHVVPDVLALPEFRRYCIPFQPHLMVEPALVIPFSTTINFGENFFGWPTGGGDNSYNSTRFATKVRSVGVWFANYDNLSGGMANTPYVYLVPVGSDVMRSPTDNLGVTREWRVLDQLLPEPFPLSASALTDPDWIPVNDTLGGELADIRRFPSLRAYHDAGVFNLDETIKDSRLIGRSVWNTRWLLIIPAGTLHSDRTEGLQRFINGGLLLDGTRDGNGVSDIKVFFQTYSYAGG